MKQKEIIINNGLLLGLVNILMLIVICFVDVTIMVDYNLICILVILLITILFGVLSVIKVKKGLDGFISFKRVFIVFFITAFIGIIINLLFTYVLFNFIDVDSGVLAKERIYESTLEQLENYNLPEHIKEIELSKVLNKDFFGIYELLKSSISILIVTGVLGIIISFVLKNDE
tara:strand:+ start:1726 stop:2244 length:519 start_codon:yes stop_codon:yes gene_type:complete